MLLRIIEYFQIICHTMRTDTLLLLPNLTRMWRCYAYFRGIIKKVITYWYRNKIAFKKARLLKGQYTIWRKNSRYFDVYVCFIIRRWRVTDWRKDRMSCSSAAGWRWDLPSVLRAATAAGENYGYRRRSRSGRYRQRFQTIVSVTTADHT